MPEVVRRQRRVTGKAGEVIAPISLGAVGGRNIETIGGALSDIGGVIQDLREKQLVQDRNNQAIDIGTKYDDAQRAFFTDETNKTGSDSYGNIERSEAFRDKSLNDFTKDITDPELKNRVKSRISSRSSSMADSLARHQANQREEVSRIARDNALSGVLKDSYDGLESVGQSVASLEETIRFQRDAGALGEEEAVDLVVKGTQEIAEASLDGLINRNSELGIKAIESGIYDKYLPQEKIEEYDKRAKTLQGAVDNDLKAQKKERERLAKVALKESQDETGNDALEMLTNGTLTQEFVMKSNLDPTGENSKEHWLKELEKRNKKVEKKDDEWKTVPAVEADLITRITEDPESVLDSEITNKQGLGLSTSDAKALLSFKKRMIKGEEDPVKEQEMKTAIKRLSDAKTARFYNPGASPENRVENSKLWAEDVNNLKRYALSHPDEDINLYVDQLLEPVEQSWTQHFLDIVSFGQPGLEEAKKARKEALGIETGEELKIEIEGIEPQKETKNRDAAIKILKENKKTITEANINFVMEQL